MSLDIHVNHPHPPEILSPPYYHHLLLALQREPKRIARSIVFGLLIDNEDGRAWFKKTYDYEFKSNHIEDLGISLQLDDLVIEKDMAFGCCPAPRRLELVDDYLVITQIERGPFIHDGPKTYDEDLQEDTKPIPGLKEEKVKTWLEKELGK